MRTPEQNPPSGSSLCRYIRSLSYQPAEGMDSPLSLGGLLVSLSLDPACRTCSKRVPIDSLRPKQFAAQPDLPSWVYARAIFPADFAGECSPLPRGRGREKRHGSCCADACCCHCRRWRYHKERCVQHRPNPENPTGTTPVALIWVHAAPTAAHRRPTPHSHCLISLRTTAAAARLRSRVNQYGLALKGVRDFTHRAGWMLFQSCPAVHVYVFRRPPAGYVPLLC